MLRLCLETNDGRFVSLLEAMMEDVLVPVLSETTDVIRYNLQFVVLISIHIACPLHNLLCAELLGHGL